MEKREAIVTKGIMYKVYANLQNPHCSETGTPILPGERFLFKDGSFYCAKSSTYYLFLDNAVLHEW